jgi:hypothetical protein
MSDARDTAATSVDDNNRHGGSGAEAPPAAKGGATISITVVLLVLLVASVAAFLMSPPPGGKPPAPMEGPGSRSGYEPVEHAVGHGTPGFNSRLDALRAWAKLTWMKLQRPRSDEPRYVSCSWLVLR